MCVGVEFSRYLAPLIKLRLRVKSLFYVGVRSSKNFNIRFRVVTLICIRCVRTSPFYCSRLAIINGIIPKNICCFRKGLPLFRSRRE